MPFLTLAAIVVSLHSPRQNPVGRPSTAFAPKLTLGRPVQVGNVSLVPIQSSAPLAGEKYLTLAEASRRGVIEIIEAPGQDNFTILQVQNRADLPILLFAGELLLGGKQDRIVAKDSIIPPRGRADINVFCVEHGRWEGSPSFHYANTLVPEAVRSVAVNEQSQAHVWSRVANSNAKVAAAPSTGTLRGTLDSPRIQAESKRLFAEMASRFAGSAGTVGVICWIDGKIESADIYAGAAMFRAGRDELFRSYAVDAQMAGKAKRVPVDMGECAKFLAHIVAARRTNQEAGRFQVRDGDINGVEFGAGRFHGGFGGASGGFGHGTYRPNGG